MATNKTLEQIQFNIANGISSFDDLKTVLSRYQEIMEELETSDPQMYKRYKRREKKA